MSPLTPYSPGLPILQPSGVTEVGEGADDVNFKVQQGSRWSCGRHSDVFTSLVRDGESSASIGTLESGSFGSPCEVPGGHGNALNARTAI